MILLISAIISGIVLWVIGMGLAARISDTHDEFVLMLLLWWIILPVTLLEELYLLVVGE